MTISTELQEALDLLSGSDRPAHALDIDVGDWDAPKRWALSLFGPECRPLVRSGAGRSAIRPTERDVVVEVDLFHQEPEMLELLARVARTGIGARVARASVVPIRNVPYHRIELEVRIHLSNPLVTTPPVATIPLSKVSEADLMACSQCGAKHSVYVFRKPYPGADRSTFEEPCRRCWEGTLFITAWDNYTIELVDEST